MKTFLESLKERVIVFDGAMGTSLQARRATLAAKSLEGCNENLVLTRPDVIADVHAAFFEAGADVVETDTFGATSIVLAEYDIADRAYEINRRSRANRLPRRRPVHHTRPPRWVAARARRPSCCRSATSGTPR